MRYQLMHGARRQKYSGYYKRNFIPIITDKSRERLRDIDGSREGMRDDTPERPLLEPNLLQKPKQNVQGYYPEKYKLERNYKNSKEGNLDRNSILDLLTLYFKHTSANEEEFRKRLGYIGGCKITKSGFVEFLKTGRLCGGRVALINHRFGLTG